jgi:tetratricopeptide (TPR) repeat protein
MICPILSQSRRDDEGNVSWDHHECIENSCTFWADEISDCGIRASGLLVIQRARAALAVRDHGEGDQVPAGEPLFAPPRLVLDEAAARPLMDAVHEGNSSAREIGLKVLEGISALEDPLKASTRELAEKIEIVRESLAVSSTMNGHVAGIEERLDRLRRGIETALETRSGPIESILTALESMTRAIASLQERQERSSGSMDRVEADLASLRGLRDEVTGGLREGLDDVNRRLGDISDRVVSAEEDRQVIRRLAAEIGGLSGRLDSIAAKADRMSTAHEEMTAVLAREAEHRRGMEQQRHKDEAMALNARGVALYYRGAAEAAASAFAAAIERDPGFAEAHNNLGLAYSRQGRDADAQACFGKALELDPQMAEALNNLGFLFHQDREFEKAADLFRRSALTAKDSSTAYTNLGNACYQMRRYADAVQAWKKAMECDPMNEAARRALALFQQNEQQRH